MARTMIDAENDLPGLGSCCSELREAMRGEDFEPLISEGDDGILYFAVGLIDLEDDEPGLVDHPMFFCPFCGTQLQTQDAVKSKSASSTGAEE